MQQWTDFRTNFSLEKWGGVGDASPCRKNWGTPIPRVPAPLHPWVDLFRSVHFVRREHSNVNTYV